MTKQQFLTYYNDRIKSIEESEEMNYFYVSGTESRELIGVINFCWYNDIITSEEARKLRDIAYEHKAKAELVLHKSL